MVWAASPEAQFLNGKFASCNWDVEDLKAAADKIAASDALELGLYGFREGGGAVSRVSIR